MILNEFDAYQEALKKINLNEEVMPIYKGRILTENVDIYCKIQKLLGCNAFEGAHRWLYDLDIENLDESECSKVCNLYQLGIDRGFIDDDSAASTVDPNTGSDLSAAPAETPDSVSVPETPATPAPAPAPAAPMAAYTVVYSATRDGQIKTGEAYSNSLNTRSAKADVIAKLEKAGYQNISILAIEAGDPDLTGCDNTYCKQSDYVPPAYEDEEEKVEEADDREPLAHGLDAAGVKASTANTAAQDAVEMTITEDEAKAEVKKAFDEVNKAFGDDDIEKDKTRKWLDDNKEAIENIRAKLKPEDAKKLDIITQTLEAFSNGKLAEAEEVDEAKGGKKPKTGIMTLIRGLFKILCTLVSLSGSAIGFSGKIVTWAGSIISAGADKINLMIKDSEDENQVNEDGEDEEKSDDSDEGDESKTDDEKEDSADAKDDGAADDDKKDDGDKKKEAAEEPDEKLKDDKKEEDGKEDATDDKEEKELSAQEKTQLKDSYKKAFKAAMLKCKYIDKCFDDLTLEEKVKFFETIDEAWGNKADPSKFMTDKETEQLQKIVVKK